MEKGKLTAIIKSPLNSNFDEQYRVLTIAEGESFTVGIKEYEDGKKDILKKIDDLEKEKNIIDSNLTTKEEQLFQQAKERYTEGGKWLDSKKHNGKIITQAEETYKANLDRERAKAKKLKDDKDILIKKLEDDLKDLEATFDSVVWAWNLATNRSSKPSGRLKLGKGHRERIIIMDKLSSGGGFSWIEPFWDDKKPTGSIKNGLYYHSMPQKPDVIIAEWYRVDKSENFVKIDQPVAPGSKVQLHVYTTNLYGQNIQIELKANGKTLKANTYGNTFIMHSNKNPKVKKKESEMIYELQNSEDFFLTEVEIYDYSDPSSIQPPVGSVIGSLTDMSGGSLISLPNVQKAILNFYVDPIWSFGVPEIIIKPTIHFLGKNKELNAELKINGHKNPEIKIPDTGNKPVFLDKVETDFRAFHPCGYNIFEISDGSRTVNLLEDKSIPPLDLFELVAEPKENTHDITIDLDTDTSECSFDGAPDDHEKHVLTLTEYPEKKIEQNAKPEEEKSSTSFDSKLKVQIGGDKNNMSHKHQLGFSGKLEKYTADGDDKQLKFKARFIYDYTSITFAGFSVHPIFRYFWLGKGVPTNTYLVQTRTCRYQQDVAVVTYPDVAWSLKLSYKNAAVERELWGNQRYVDTKKAKFKREPQKWITAGDKSIGISLGATWDNGNTYDATADITKQVQKLLDSLGVIGKFVNSVFLGNENNGDKNNEHATDENKEALEKIKNQQQGKNATADAEKNKDKELNELKRNFNGAKQRYDTAQTERDREKAKSDMTSLQRKMDSRSADLDLKLTRSIASISIQWPQLDAQFEWSLENIDQHGPYYNQTGVVLQGVLELTPLVGLTATLDFLALAQRAHPVALAVIAAADITLAIIGDGSKITCDLTASGNFGGKVRGFLNTKTGENSFNKDDRNTNDKQLAELKCDLEFNLEIGIRLNIKKKNILAEVILTGEVNAKATAKWTGRAPLDTDDYGWYIAPEMTFEGLEIKGEANFKGDLKTGKGTPMGSVSSNNEFKWQAIDAWEKPKQ